MSVSLRSLGLRLARSLVADECRWHAERGVEQVPAVRRVNGTWLCKVCIEVEGLA